MTEDKPKRNVVKINDYTQYETDVTKAYYYEDGRVVIRHKSGIKFIGEGEFFGDPVGKGILYRPDGTRLIEGTWDKMTERVENAIKYRRDGKTPYIKSSWFRNNGYRACGEGERYYSDGVTVKYRGPFENNRYVTGGVYYYPDGSYYDGMFDHHGWMSTVKDNGYSGHHNQCGIKWPNGNKKTHGTWSEDSPCETNDYDEKGNLIREGGDQFYIWEYKDGVYVVKEKYKEQEENKLRRLLEKCITITDELIDMI